MRFILLLLLALTSAYAAERPNIIVVLCDDLGYGDLACYGHPHIKTPHLDKMAKEGIRYTACYSSAPVCSPSRVGLMTGRSPNRAGVYDWIPPSNPKTKKRDQRHLVHMQKDEVTIPALLKKAGYATCLSGKWHCNAMFNSEAQPQPNDAGFDHWFATQNNAAPSHANPTNYVRNGEPVGKLDGYSCILAADELIGWMKNKGTPETDQPPFFGYLAFHEPHEPVASPKELVDGYMEVAKSRDQAEYFANVENIDVAVGNVLKALKDSGKDKNTLVIFTSDNGPETLLRYGKRAGRSFGTPKPLRGMKLWTTEAGFRVAGIARWPGKIDADQVVDTPVSALDFLPTFCKLAGADVPSDLQLDGVALPDDFGAKPFDRPKPLVWCYYNAINVERVAMRHGDWKVLAKLNGGAVKKFSNVFKGNAEMVKTAKLTDIEIYMVTEDIAESKNLAEDKPEKTEELRKVLEKAYSELVADSHVWGE